MCQDHQKKSCHISLHTALFQGTDACIRRKTFIYHDIGTIICLNMCALCIMRTVLHNMGALCDIKSALCDIGCAMIISL